MTRVLFLLSHTEKGGGEVVVHNLVKHLDRRRFEPLVGHVDVRRGDFIHEFVRLGVTPVDFRAGRLRHPARAAATVWRLARFLRRERVGLVVTSGAHNHVYAGLARRLVRVPILAYVMNHCAPRRRDNPPIVRLALALGADAYLAPSRTCLQPLERLIPAGTPRAVLHHGVDEDWIAGPADPARVRARLGLRPGQPLVAAIGRLQRWKGQDLFLEAAARVREAHPAARFAVVGGALFGLEQDFAAELGRLVAALGLADRCHLVGHQPEARDWMAAADIVVHSARLPEPGGNVVLEAMALGRPVVAAGAGAPAELVEDGRTGLLFAPGDAADLARQMDRLLADPARAAALGRAAAERVGRDLTARAMADRLGQHLERLARRPRTVLFTLSSTRRAGHEASVRNIVEALDRERFRPLAVFLCQEDGGGFPDELEALGAEVVVRRVGRLRNPPGALRTAAWLGRLMRRHRAALVLTAGGHNHAYARLAALLARTPTIGHENFLFRRPFWRNGPIYALNLLLGAEAWLCTGRLAAAALRAADPRRRPVVHVPHMVDLGRFDWRRDGRAFRAGLGIPAEAPVFAMVGRIQAWKGQEVFVRAALEVCRRSAEACFCVAGGGWGPADRDLEERLRRMVREAGLGERVRFTGFLEDPVPAYAAADVVCHCSIEPEPLGLVILEAHAMKKPVISVAAGGPLELVRPGIDGWLLPPGDVDSLVDTMKQCLAARDQLAEMGEQGYRRVRDEHGPAAFVPRINALVSRHAS